MTTRARTTDGLILGAQYTVALDTRAGHQRCEVWRHGRLLADSEALEVIMEAYERLRRSQIPLDSV